MYNQGKKYQKLNEEGANRGNLATMDSKSTSLSTKDVMISKELDTSGKELKNFTIQDTETQLS